MRYLSFFTPDERTASQMGNPQHMEAMRKLTEEMAAAGVLVVNGAYLPDKSLGARVRASQGKLSVSDTAPETNHRAVGFAILNVKSKDEAIAMAKKFLSVAGDGECDLRPLMDAPTSR